MSTRVENGHSEAAVFDALSEPIRRVHAAVAPPLSGFCGITCDATGLCQTSMHVTACTP